MSKYSTFVIYKTGRKEVLRHKNKPDMERMRGKLKNLPTVSVYRTSTKQDLMEMRT